MTGGSGADALFYLLALLLPASALLARRLPIGQTLRMVAIWIAIFALAAAAFRAFGDRLISWQQGRRGGTVAATAGTSAATLRIPMDEDGHYWVTARVNGVATRFLIDSGASITALSDEAARAAGVARDQGAPPMTIQTANGAVQAERGTVARLALDGIVATDLPVVIAPAFGDTSVIGMNFLNKLKGWRVERNVMILDAE